METLSQSSGGDGIPSIAQVDDSELVGVSLDSVSGGGEAADPPPAAAAAVVVEVKEEVKVEEGGRGKRKRRGRPPRGQARTPPLKKVKEEEEEEDVCFICFDGGSLVLCDRRGCPKAYHPACIKRDEAFFRSSAKWNCGWHICSVCQKAAHYMCYTCTYSLCKPCTKRADYLCVRGNKGFCTLCMRTIMLIENNDQGNKEMPQVDFDDKSSWEYLFKVYWMYLKGKLSLTLDELTQAKNPWKAAGTVACKGQPLNMHYGANDGKGSIFNSPFERLEANDSKMMTKEQPMLPNTEDSLSIGKSNCDEGTTLKGSTEWASKELLEFVSHMKNGDTSVLSQFDVQSLLLDYIKRNNLRDPRKKSQIICDLRLKNMFGKPRVGHFEMLKLVEFQFHLKEDFKKDIQGNIVDAVQSQVDVGGNNENLLMVGKDKKRKTRTKGEERKPQINLDEYAAIDVHNINLIYLRRSLMESLIAEDGKFIEKVVGSVVRIRISSNDQKQDMYRLVQVVGTCKVAVPYKIGEKTADVELEILNLDKKETISIDVISNQAFSEDECRRLRQCVKCGLVKRLTIGQVLEKAVALQEVRLNDWLETEVLRLNHLRDRANEKGHKKGECVAKLEILKTPEERQRRLREIPEVHADPNMDPNCEADEDAGEVGNKKQGEYVKPRCPGFSKNRREAISLRNGFSQNNSSGRVWKKSTTHEPSRSMSNKFYLDKAAASRVVDRVYESSWYEGKVSCGSNSSEKPGNQVDSSGSVVGGWNNQAVLRSGSFSVGASETSISSLSAGGAPSSNASETDKLWHYRDPSGKIQGPFGMVQLRKWNTSGYFPPEMRIWSIDNEEVDSLLLTDVLSGKFHKVFPLRYNISLPSQGLIASDSRLKYCNNRSSGSMNTAGIDGKWSDGGWNFTNVIAHSNCNNDLMKGDGWGSQSSNWTAPVVNNNDVHMGSSSHCWDSLKVNNSCSDHLQVNCPLPSSKFTERQNGTSLHQGKGHDGRRWNSGSNHGNGNLHGNTIFHTTGEQNHENQSDSRGYSGQSSSESWKPLPVSLSSNNMDSDSGFASVARSTDSSETRIEIDVLSLPSPTPKTSNGDLEGQTNKDQPSVLLNVQKLPSPSPNLSDGDEKADSNIQNLPSPPQRPRDGDAEVQAAENRQPATSKFPVRDSGPSWSSASSLVVGGETQCPDVADKWGGCSPTRAKPSVEEWDSGLGSVSSLKPPEMASDHAATPTSKCEQLTPSPSHPAFSEPSWKVSFTEPIEFSTLAEESVSDLLAEVDAMESQCGLASPTSVMYSGDELFQDSNNDCFNSIGELSPPLDSGKSDALSSTGDIALPHQSTMTDEPLGASKADVFDPIKRCSVQSFTSIEVEVETRPTYFSVNQSEVGSSSQFPASSSLSGDTIETVTTQSEGPKPMSAAWGTMQGNMNLGLGVSIQGMTDMGQGNCLLWESQPMYGGERFFSPRDWDFENGDAGFGWGRPPWSRHSSHGDGSGGGGRKLL